VGLRAQAAVHVEGAAGHVAGLLGGEKARARRDLLGAAGAARGDGAQKLAVEAIDTEAVLQVLEPIWSTIPETASRVRGRIETVLDFAGRTGANPARWNGHLEHKLVKRNKARTVRHLPALPYAEMGAFMAALRAVLEQETW